MYAVLTAAVWMMISAVPCAAGALIRASLDVDTRGTRAVATLFPAAN
ncbi:hypothetical protein ABE493_04415 [Stenotrophomonas terrae]